jgi:hypothetical protein
MLPTAANSPPCVLSTFRFYALRPTHGSTTPERVGPNPIMSPRGSSVRKLTTPRGFSMGPSPSIRPGVIAPRDGSHCGQRRT